MAMVCSIRKPERLLQMKVQANAAPAAAFCFYEQSRRRGEALFSFKSELIAKLRKSFGLQASRFIITRRDRRTGGGKRASCGRQCRTSACDREHDKDAA